MLRLAAVAAITRIQTSGHIQTFDSPGDWNTPPEALPAVRMRCGDEHMESMNKGQANFKTTVPLEVEGRVSATTQEAAQDAIDLLYYNVQNALLGDPNIVSMMEQLTVSVQFEITADAKLHFGGFKARIDVLMAEEFDQFDPSMLLTAWPPDTWPPVPVTPANLTDVEVTFTDPSTPGAGLSITLP